MKSELIVDVQSDEIAIALTEDDRLMEVNVESKTQANFAVGNIYYGRVKKVMPALNAVFVDVGYEKEAFLHYLDLGPQFLTLEKFTQFAVQDKNRKPLMTKTPQQKEVGKQGSIAEVCRVGQEILVQVAKEPINTKGPRLTAEISLAGRNIVLIPFGDKVMVSNKIRSEAERSRLKQLVQAIKPEKFGVIVRTVAEGKRVAELDAELRLLVKRWEDTVARLQKAKPVSLVAEEIGRTIGVIRDIFTPDFTAIHVNDADMYEEVKSYVSLISPESEKNVKLYTDNQPIFDHFQITRQMKTGLGHTVGFKNGGYLIMERTEALFSIDVNSGSKKLGLDQEDNAFRCNMLAADEIYHQLRLRDIGGIIIVDFIDMDSAEHRQQLFEHMRQLMKRDRARHNVLQLSKFGLMQITRQRVRPVVEVDVQEECPVCHGKGRIQPSILFTDTLDEHIELYKSHFGRGLRLYVHPFVYAYATRGFFLTNLRMKWLRRYGVRLYEDQSLPLLDFRFVGRDGQAVVMPKILDESIDKKAEKKAKLYAGKTIEEKPEVKLPKEKQEKDNQPKQESKAEQKSQKSEKNVAKEAKPAQTEQVEQVPAATEQPGKKKRRRKKRSSAAAEAAPQVAQPTEQVAQPVAEPATEPAATEPKPAKKKRSSRKKSTKAAANAEQVVEVAEAAPLAAPQADSPATEAVKQDEKPAKKKRPSRKKAEVKAEEPAVEANATKVVEPAKEAPADQPAEAQPARKAQKKRAPKKTESVEVAPAQEAAPSAEKPSKKKPASKKKTPAAEKPVAEAPAQETAPEDKPKKKRAPRKKATAKKGENQAQPAESESK